MVSQLKTDWNIPRTGGVKYMHDLRVQGGTFPGEKLSVKNAKPKHKYIKLCDTLKDGNVLKEDDLHSWRGRECDLSFTIHYGATFLLLKMYKAWEKHEMDQRIMKIKE